MSEKSTGYAEGFARTQGYLAAKNAMTKPAASVLVYAFTCGSVIFLIRLVIAAATSKMDAVFASLYYFIGEQAAPVINLVAGLMIFVFLFLTSGALILTHSGAKGNNRERIHSGLSLMRGSLIFALTVTLAFILVSLCSVSVMYQAAHIKGLDHYASFGGIRSADLFALTIIFGTVAVACIIALFRYVGSLRKASDGIALNSSGAIFTIVVCFVSAFVFLISFFASLGNLVMPADIGETIQFSYVGSAAADVLLNAALAVSSACTAFVTISYYTGVSSVSRMIASNYYYQNAQYPPQAAAPQKAPSAAQPTNGAASAESFAKASEPEETKAEAEEE